MVDNTAATVTPYAASTGTAGSAVSLVSAPSSVVGMAYRSTSVIECAVEGWWLYKLNPTTGEFSDQRPAPWAARGVAIDNDGNPWVTTNLSPNTLTDAPERRLLRVDVVDRPIAFGGYFHLGVKNPGAAAEPFRTLVSNGNSTSRGIALQVNDESDAIQFAVSDGTNTVLQQRSANVANGVSIIATYDPSSQSAQLYVNGAAAGSAIDLAGVDMRNVTPHARWSIGLGDWPTSTYDYDEALTVRGCFAVEGRGERTWTATEAATAHRILMKGGFGTRRGPDGQIEHTIEADEVPNLNRLFTGVRPFQRNSFSGFTTNARRFT